MSGGPNKTSKRYLPIKIFSPFLHFYNLLMIRFTFFWREWPQRKGEWGEREREGERGEKEIGEREREGERKRESK